MKNLFSNRWLCLVLMVFLLPGCSKNSPSPAVWHSASDSAKVSDSLARTADQISDSSLTYEQREGKYSYTKYCAVCHGDDGKGDGFNAFNLDPKPRDFTDSRLMNALDDERIIRTITGGGRSVNRSNLMPSWGGRLSKEEIGYVVAYVRLFNPVK